jgi:hypothetical protein
MLWRLLTPVNRYEIRVTGWFVIQVGQPLLAVRFRSAQAEPDSQEWLSYKKLRRCGVSGGKNFQRSTQEELFGSIEIRLSV